MRLIASRAGELSLQPTERELLGDVSGKSLLHLQCHFGLDTLSWARLGATITGVDISDEAISLAQRLSTELKIPAHFIRCDLLDLPSRLEETFDIVYTSYGVLPWLSDLVPWGRLIAQCLKGGGRFCIVEAHPFTDVFDTLPGAQSFEDVRVLNNYFNREPERWEADRSYAMAEDQSHSGTEGIVWGHTMSEVVNSLAGAGLRIEQMHEYARHPYDRYLFPGEDGSGRFLDPQARLPVVFSLVASKT